MMSEVEYDNKRIGWILVVIAVVALMDGLDGSIVNVALPVIAKDFNADTGAVAWVTVTYLIMMAGLIITFARIASNGAIKRVLFYGLIIFTASSFFCGMSVNLEMLLAFRIIQGIGAAMMGAAVPMACVKFLPARNLGLGIGIITLGSSTGFALGPAVGGIITELISWHWIFLINIPLGLIIIGLMVKAIPRDGKYEHRHLDLQGSALIFSAMLCGIFAIERIAYPEERIYVIVAAVACVVLLILFIFVELRKKEPLLNVRLFKHWRFDAVLVAYLFVNLVYLGMLYLLPFYMYVCMGFSSLTSGMFLLIASSITLIFCIPISKWSDRTQRRSFSVAACLILTLGCLILFLFSDRSSLLPLIAALVCMGLNWALCGGPMGSRIIENVIDESREMGSSLLNQIIYLGSAVGVSLFAMLFTMGSGSGHMVFTDLPPDVFADGFVFTMMFGVVIAAASAVLSFIVKEPKRST